LKKVVKTYQCKECGDSCTCVVSMCVHEDADRVAIECVLSVNCESDADWYEMSVREVE